MIVGDEQPGLNRRFERPAHRAFPRSSSDRWSLCPEAREHVLAKLGGEEQPGLLALRHAVMFRRPGLWGDNARRPHSVVYLRPAGRRRQAFAAGRPEPAAAWLAAREGEITLVAPDDWEPWIRSALAPIEPRQSEVRTWYNPPIRDPQGPSPAPVRRLGPGDEPAFLSIAPDWALLGWGGFNDLVRHGAIFGVPFLDGFVSIAWIFDQTARYDAIGVFTIPRFRRLGLARASARSLIRFSQKDRSKTPLWSAHADNIGTHALALSLGFDGPTSEMILSWPASTAGLEAGLLT